MIKTLDTENEIKYSIFNKFNSEGVADELATFTINKRLTRNNEIKDMVYKFIKDLERQVYGY